MNAFQVIKLYINSFFFKKISFKRRLKFCVLFNNKESNIHDICSGIERTSVWGTLSSSDLINSKNKHRSRSSGSDCWCQLSAYNSQRIILSIISFSLFDKDPECHTSGLYLQSTRNRSDECTHLKKKHYYISSAQELFINFYVKGDELRGVVAGSDDPEPGSFWIVYEGLLFYFLLFQ